MKEKRLLKKAWRYHRISYIKRLEALICLYKDCIYIKIDTVFDDLSPRITHYEAFMTSKLHYDDIVVILILRGITEKLARKVGDVLVQWNAKGLFTFDATDAIQINGGQIDE